MLARLALALLMALAGGWLVSRLAAQPRADAALGARIASGGGPGGTAAACMTCHGADGGGERASGFPRLAALPARYLAKQLDDYANGSRPNEIMTPIALDLSAEQRRAVSAFYAAMPAPTPLPQRAADSTALQRGAALYAQGSRHLGVQACINCHGPGGRGLNETYPAIAAQPEAYTVAQLQAWRDGQRTNDPAGAMATVARKLGDEEIRAVALYLEGLQP